MNDMAMETRKKRTRSTPKCKIDRTLLEQALAKRGMTLTSASERIGYCRTYLNVIVSRDCEVPQRVLLLLQEKFGIRTETIMPGYDPTKELEKEYNDLRKLAESQKNQPIVMFPDTATPDAVTSFVSALYDFIKAASHDGCAEAIKELL